MSEFIDEDIQLAVKRGAYWLDDNHPNWVARIDLDDLRMQSCTNCVIGQAVGDYYLTTGIAAMKASTGSDEWAREHGFCAPNNETEEAEYRYYIQLETVWTDEVQKRLG